MRVAHLTTVDASLRFLLLPQLLAARDTGDSVVGISAPGRWVQELEAAGITHVPLTSSTRSMNILADIRAVKQLWTILRRHRVDVLHTHNPKPGVYGRIVGRLAGLPIVVNTNHGLYATPDDRLFKRLIVYVVEAVASRFSDAELVQSSEDLAVMQRWHLASRRKMQWLGNGVDLQRFDPARYLPEDRAVARRALRLRDDQIAVGIVGRLVAEKGFPELFAAMERLDDQYVLIAIGPHDPDKADRLTAQTIASARDRGVRFLGMRSDVDDLYNALDIFVLPSHREGVPRAAMEAAAMGLPVVAADVRGCREVVEHGANGLLVPVGDPDALARAIERLGSHASLREAMGRAGHERARNRFDERRVVETVMQTYRSVAERKRRRRRSRALAVKRLVDVSIAAPGLVVLSPFLSLVATMIRLSLGRPVLFVQERPGRDGHVFRLYKFRTMRDARDGDGRLLADAARLTRIGRFIRAWSLDELPQLVNVVKGDMSLVGPRPLLVEYLDRYTSEQARRHTMRPGITGWSQIGGRNAISWEEKLALDVWYVDHWSVGLDLRILAITLRNVIGRRGVTFEGHATMPEFLGSEIRNRTPHEGAHEAGRSDGADSRDAERTRGHPR
jgi:lipopolysaccharide/colanic/teichoic acid biosynthesis glycosyltransferase